MPLTFPLAALLAAALTAWAYWPGLMTWDSVRQYDEALSGNITDWHPPSMQWVWRRLLVLKSGPHPMLLLQLSLYWGGLIVLARAMWHRRRPYLAWGLLACGLWPLGVALTGMILKDSLMAAALLCAVGLLATRGDRRRPLLSALTAVCLIFASTLRFNAFTACLPLMVALFPKSWRNGWPRLGLISILTTAGLMTAMPLADRMIGAQPSGVELSLVIFDLGGITERSGDNAFPPTLRMPDVIGVNHRCYRASKWDSYSDWVDPECPLGFTAWNDKVDPHDTHPYPFWARALLSHPLAYASHRLGHFAINSRLVSIDDAVERPVPLESAPNVWGFQVNEHVPQRALDAMAVAAAHTPFGWPIVAIGLALGAVIASWGLPCAELIAPIALSSFLYGAGYLIVSVAAELRYHLWTQMAALIAVVLVAGEARTIGLRRLVLACIPATLAVGACLYWRW